MTTGPPLFALWAAGPVDAADPGIFGARCCISGEPLTVRDVVDSPPPVRAHARFLEERLVDGGTAPIAEIAVRNGCTVNLRPHYSPQRTETRSEWHCR